MSDLDRPRLALYVALGLIVCFLGARYLRSQVTRAARRASVTVAARDDAGAEPGAAPTVRIERADGGRVTVHVAGAVRRPGPLPPARGRARGRRAAARGRPGSARGPHRGQPRGEARGRPPGARAAARRRGAAGGGRRGRLGARPAAAAGGGGAPAGRAAPAAPVNLNTATLEQLDTLDGVGPGIAQRILDYREQHGGFRRVEELGEVPGIGDKRLATLTPLVTV